MESPNTILRFKFTKGPEVQFLSHLDQVRAMERALRRAKLPIAYSEGFTPRPIMSYSFALPVGALSVAEYGDYEFTETLAPGEFQTRFNQHLPPGFRVLVAEQLSPGRFALMREVQAAAWQVVLPGRTVQEVVERWQWLMERPTFLVERENKKGRSQVDVRPFLFEVSECKEEGEGVSFRCLSALGQEANLRLTELAELLGFDLLEATITRMGQYTKAGEHFSSPLGKEG